MLCSPVCSFLDSVVVVFLSFAGSWVRAVSSFEVVFEDFVDGVGECCAEMLRGKSPPGR